MKARSRIGLKTLRSIVLPVSGILAVAVAGTVIVTHGSSVARLQEKVRRLGTEHRASVEGMLWQFDLSGIERQLAGFVDQDDVRWASVSDVTGRVIAVGREEGGEDAIEHTVPLTHRDADGELETLGTMTVQASTENVWSDALRRALALIAIAVATMSVTALLVLRRIDRTVLSPLLRVAGALRDAPPALSELHIDLERGPGYVEADEIDTVVEAVHDMRDRILAAESDAEARERRLADAAQMAGLSYCTFDPRLERVVECDENYAALFGTTVAELLSRNARDVLHGLLDEEGIADAEASRRRVLTGESDLLTLRLRFDDGDVVCVRQLHVPIRDENGAVTNVSAVARDVTDETRRQEMFLQTQKSEAIGKLTGGVAHDFNNILTAIVGNLEMMIARSADRSVRARGESALEAAELGAELTRQLLSFARQRPLSPVGLDVAKTVRGASELLRASVGESIDLAIDGGETLWRTRADPAQLEAVLLNLVVNARDAMPDGGSLTIGVANARLDETYAKAHLEVEAGDYVCVSVSDSGTGMTPRTARRAIEPYFTTKEIGRGTGLGLSMAFGFATQSGGHLRIDSEVGRGTTVRLYLPREHADGTAKPSATSAVQRRGPATPAATAEDVVGAGDA